MTSKSDVTSMMRCYTEGLFVTVAKNAIEKVLPENEQPHHGNECLQIR